jgi:hypothetical protein
MLISKITFEVAFPAPNLLGLMVHIRGTAGQHVALGVVEKTSRTSAAAFRMIHDLI